MYRETLRCWCIKRQNSEWHVFGADDSNRICRESSHSQPSLKLHPEAHTDRVREVFDCSQWLCGFLVKLGLSKNLDVLVRCTAASSDPTTATWKTTMPILPLKQPVQTTCRLLQGYSIHLNAIGKPVHQCSLTKNDLSIILLSSCHVQYVKKRPKCWALSYTSY